MGGDCPEPYMRGSKNIEENSLLLLLQKSGHKTVSDDE